MTAYYAWADTAYDLAWTLAVIHGRKAGDVLAAYGARTDIEPVSSTFEVAMSERNEHLGDYGLVQLVEHHGHVLAIEPNGWVGNAPEVARALSSPTGRFLSVYWSPKFPPAHPGRGRQAGGTLRPHVHRSARRSQ